MSDENLNISWPGWETVKLIGRGSFGAVYEIERNLEKAGIEEKAALKVISIPQNASDIEEMYNDGYDNDSITETFNGHLKSIVAEYSLMKKMNDCVNIVNCDDIRYIQHDDGIGWDIFIKMELLTPLTKSLPETITDDIVIKLGSDICNALITCKKFDIVHRDIKPQNIFISPNGDYKLGDFGIAKTVEMTMGGTKIGTYKYMAPEVYNTAFIKPYLYVETAIFMKPFPFEIREADTYVYRFLKDQKQEQIIEQYGLTPFSIKVQTLDRTFIDKMFALGDYYLTGKTKGYSRHLYDLYKIMPEIAFDNNFFELYDEVKEIRSRDVDCPSAKPEQNLKELLEKIYDTDYFKSDYEDVTKELLFENVPYSVVKDNLKNVIKKTF